MDESQKRRLARCHDRDLDAEFETFEHNGATYHAVGLMQAWVRGYTDPDVHMMTDPPVWNKAFSGWLERHGCGIAEAMVGPPTIRFPDRKTADLFMVEWHARARKRYPYAQREEYERVTGSTNRAILAELRREAAEKARKGIPKDNV